MKQSKLLLIAVITFSFYACDKSDELEIDKLTGTYIGSLSNTNLKSALAEGHGSDDATADVEHIGDGQIQVHCYSADFDTTIILDYYHNNDSVMVCLAGNDFSKIYGHMKGEGHMSGGMMGDMRGDETEWMHHKDDEHQDGDEHFGGFHPGSETFEYTFIMPEGYMKFKGQKH